ncbi:MAG: ribbon-helix-helix protein, CopG family [Elusimicrobia bacterium]|nr:ribbon-helix-helix protein, CopG family [Elusimicrobiota bacterium]
MLPPEMLTRLKVTAAQRGESVGECMRRAVEAWLRRAGGRA